MLQTTHSLQRASESKAAEVLADRARTAAPTTGSADESPTKTRKVPGITVHRPRAES